MPQSNRKKVDPEKYIVRRLPPWSTYWKQGQPTSAAFNDAELSVDVYEDKTEEYCEQAREDNAVYLEKGFGLAISKVTNVNQALEMEPPIMGKHPDTGESEIGVTYHDKLENNPRHCLVTGNATKAKKRRLKAVFEVCISPSVS